MFMVDFGCFVFCFFLEVLVDDFSVVFGLKLEREFVYILWLMQLEYFCLIVFMYFFLRCWIFFLVDLSFDILDFSIDIICFEVR